MILQFLLCRPYLCLLTTEDIKPPFCCFYFQDEATTIMFPLIVIEILCMIAVGTGIVV